ncbi:MAG: Uma2 family endonuclease [Chloroflexi bacterium]|nr:MAG: Uma2 family endonuclease [Chloroflexota bacterium]
MSTTSPVVEKAAEAPEALPIIEHLPVDHLVTEDDTPVDNLFSEKQQRLLTEPLYSSWAGPGEGRPFLVMANVGLFYALYKPPIVPDVLLSLDVKAPSDLLPKEHRSYFVWLYGKPPDVVIEIVSNREGEELGRKLETYARIGVPYYVVFDPGELLGIGLLRVHELSPLKPPQVISEKELPGVGLGLTLWQGEYEGVEALWLRWCDLEGRVIPTGAERAEQERRRAERLAAQLRALGVEPENG